MANEEQLARLKQGVEVWNGWRGKNFRKSVDLISADLSGADLRGAHLFGAKFEAANLSGTDLRGAYLRGAELIAADLRGAHLNGADLVDVNLRGAKLIGADLGGADLRGAYLWRTDLSEANLSEADLGKAALMGAVLIGSNFLDAVVGDTIFGNSDLSQAIRLDDVIHGAPSTISTDTFARSKGKISKVFLQGCGLSDWEIELMKLYNPDLSNDEINKTLDKMYDLRATQALQISPLFISYSHADGEFVDKLGDHLAGKGIRYWRDIHDAKAGRLEKQIDQAIRQNRIVLLVLSKHSIKSDWVEHEVRTARKLEKKRGRDALCPIALDGSWKRTKWPERVMEQVKEYNILDFSAWKDDSKFGNTFGKLIDGLGLFYKG